ncbi:MAG: CTP synthase, partial [Carnobacterium sp.]
TQHSVKELRGLGIQPNILVVRSERPVSQNLKNKLASFCDVAPEAVIESLDVDTLYSIPLNLQKQGMDQIVCDHLKIDAPPADMTEWIKLEERVLNLSKKTRIALVGKYVELPDAYLSVVESLNHAGYAEDSEIEIDWINADEVTTSNAAELLKDADGILVPGGFGDRGLEGKIAAIQYARENTVPFFGICLGMQLACVEFARNVVGLEGAHSTETDPETPHNIIDLMSDQKDVVEMGGTLRLGLYPCKLKAGSVAAQNYGNAEVVQERHRHRYEFNNDYRTLLEDKGMVFSGVSPDNRLVEIVELSDHPFYVACQFHPEFLSRPNRPQKLFSGFVKASLNNQH